MRSPTCRFRRPQFIFTLAAFYYSLEGRLTCVHTLVPPLTLVHSAASGKEDFKQGNSLPVGVSAWRDLAPRPRQLAISVRVSPVLFHLVGVAEEHRNIFWTSGDVVAHHPSGSVPCASRY